MITASGASSRNAVFLDTSGLMALISNDDHWHGVAEDQWNRLIASRRRFVTTSLVLIELGDGLSRIRHRQSAVRLRRSLLSHERVVVVAENRRIEEAAWRVFEERTDKEWGMTDCISMTVMWQKRINDDFSLDRHFLQAGFHTLLRR